MKLKMYKIIILIIASLISFSCATSSGSSRGSLSDAFRESQEDNGVPPSRDDDEDDDNFIFWPEVDEDAQYDDSYSRATTDSDDPIYLPQGFQTTYNYNLNSDIVMGLGSDYILGDYINRYGLFFLSGLAWNLYYPEDSTLSAFNDSLIRLNIGLHHRFSITDRDEGLYFDIIADTIVTNHYWEYKYPLENEIEYDGITGLDLGLGVGISFKDEDGNYLFIDPTVGVNLMGQITHKAYDNDVFDHHPYIKLGVKVLFNNATAP